MTVEDNWILGEIFFKKYSVYFDFDNEKVILKKTGIPEPFLKPEEEPIVPTPVQKSNTVTILVIVLVVFVVALCIGLVFYYNRKNKMTQHNIGDASRYDFIVN